MKKTLFAVIAVFVMFSCVVAESMAEEPPWEMVSVRFTPRSLNLGSKGGWVSCTISGLPEGYVPADIDTDTLCIVEVNGMELDGDGGPICSKDSGAKNNSSGNNKLKIKFSRKDLADVITEYSDESPDNATITVEGYGLDGILQFYGDDTIKVKPAKNKEKKEKKDK